MTDLERYLRSKPWWNCRFMWGEAVAVALVIDAVFHSRFTFGGWEIEDVLA